MLRKYLNSELILIDLESIEDIFLDNKTFLVIQNERLNDKYILVEKVKREDLFELIPFGNLTPQTPTKTPQVDEDLIYDYRETIINNDPFGKYSGTKLGEIFDKNDIGWVNNCIKNMKNTYIKDRVNYLAKYYKVV